MELLNLYKKCFLGGCWTLAFRNIDENEIILGNHFQKYEYKVLNPTKRFWYADPFPYIVDNKVFVFCEIYDEHKKKGCIGVTEINESEMCTPKIIIEQDYHMSYPCVFNHNGEYYLIPETSENNTIELYRAIEFPYKWILDTILVENVCAVDTTLFKRGDNLLLITYEYKIGLTYLKIYKLDMSVKKIEIQFIKQDLNNTGRPAGNIYQYEDKLIRPSQDQGSTYGEKVILNEIVEWETFKFIEKQVGTLSASNITIKNYREIKRIHTMNRIANIEVIDVRTEVFDIFLIIKKFSRKIKTILRK